MLVRIIVALLYVLRTYYSNPLHRRRFNYIFWGYNISQSKATINVTLSFELRDCSQSIKSSVYSRLLKGIRLFLEGEGVIFYSLLNMIIYDYIFNCTWLIFKFKTLIYLLVFFWLFRRRVYNPLDRLCIYDTWIVVLFSKRDVDRWMWNR